MEKAGHTVPAPLAVAVPDIAVPDIAVPAVAQELGVHPETVRRLLLSCSLPGYKAGGRWRVTRAALDGFKAGGGARPVGRPARGGNRGGEGEGGRV